MSWYTDKRIKVLEQAASSDNVRLTRLETQMGMIETFINELAADPTNKELIKELVEHLKSELNDIDIEGV